MPVTFVKSKEKVAAKTDPKGVVLDKKEEIRNEVDNLGTLTQELSNLKTDPAVIALIAKEDELKKSKEKIQALADELFKADEENKVSGKKFMASIGMKANKSEIKEDGGKDAIFEILGEDTFLKLCDFKLGDLRKYMTEPQLENVLTTERSGARTVKLL